MTSVKDDLPDHALALLGYVMDGMRRDVHARSAAGAGAATGLRSSQLRLLSLTPVDGMRVTDLAERVGMTKQALGEFANALEDRGLMESVRDDQDRRIRILRPTEQGRRAVADGEALIAEVEADWRRRLGAQRWERLRALLLAAAELGPGQPAE
ncbi:hypothetical protein ASG88_15505 [Nocardioides sp. Soil777]|uniref:MarR family winged helix-turn-helix transcriptional regulator n=1 Tax=Nocardioides sp. Soil777 TaxID=1736409 RepID=UPI000703B0C9|nr:MarR family winged helix-turn-helix transcriptional regulator [Nocardioides sp. Soil777]KRE99132.1 hypothetical protein ASG88_15505 [Nocardioides sp. Soil777]